jgi:phage terminase small subunit
MVSEAGQLAQTEQPRGGCTVEGLVTELIRPILKTWLDDNLPALAERLVRAEIERVSRANRLNADGQEERPALLRDKPPEPPQDLSPQEAEIWQATVDGMKAQNLLRDFDEFCAQVSKLETERATDIKEHQLALASFRAACKRLAGSIARRQGRIHDRGEPPPAPSVA